MKKISIGLLPRILIAIVLGIVLGNVLTAPLVRIFVTFNAIFSPFLNFLIPLLIVGLVTPPSPTLAEEPANCCSPQWSLPM